MVLILLYILCSESLYSSKVVLWDKVCINIEECVDLDQIPVLCLLFLYNNGSFPNVKLHLILRHNMKKDFRYRCDLFLCCYDKD